MVPVGTHVHVCVYTVYSEITQMSSVLRSQLPAVDWCSCGISSECVTESVMCDVVHNYAVVNSCIIPTVGSRAHYSV